MRSSLDSLCRTLRQKNGGAGVDQSIEDYYLPYPIPGGAESVRYNSDKLPLLVTYKTEAPCRSVYQEIYGARPDRWTQLQKPSWSKASV